MPETASARPRERARPPSSRRHVFTPELLARIRHRYENTTDTVPDIAAELGVHKVTLQRMANRENWVRYVPPPHDLTPSARLLAQAEALETLAARADDPAPDDGAPVDLAAAADLLERELQEQIAGLKTVRAQLSGRPQSPRDSAENSRTLSNLTATLHKLENQRCKRPVYGSDRYDDIPADLDAFRERLAQRILAFVASRSGEGAAP